MSDQRSLFDNLPESYDYDWTPEPLVPLPADVRSVFLDFESTGLRWWAGDRPIGCAVRSAAGARYIPWAHAGGNLPEIQCRRWLQTELRGRRIDNHNVRFEIHMAREWGVDLEAMDVTVGDSGHWIALLDDHRQDFSLDALAKDLLGIGKLGADLDKKRLAEYHAGRVAPYALRDVELVEKLKAYAWPRLTEEGLHTVRELEEQVIWVVCEMERNGARIDLDLLRQWKTRIDKEIADLVWTIYRDTGVKVDPQSSRSKAELFRTLKITPTEFTASGAPSFTDSVLKQIPHPVVQTLRRAARLASLRSKYIDGDLKSVSSDGVLRFSLHQLRAQRDDTDSRGGGTITGRFSSTAITRTEGVNIQQRIKPAKQRVMFGIAEDDTSHDEDLYIVRRIHVPEPGRLFFASDMMQVEYRLFAHFAATPSVIAGYRHDPTMSFHKFVWALVREYKPDISYRRLKDLNFAKIYGASLLKMALMLEFITPAQWNDLRGLELHQLRTHPLLATTREVDAIYNRVLPEVRPLLQRASQLAKERGYVKTLLGRRMRFPDGQQLHKALNGVIQGGAADLNKLKLVELYRERKRLGITLRFTVHDEVVGDVVDQHHADLMHELLNRQSMDLKVPILWETNTGANWAEC